MAAKDIVTKDYIKDTKVFADAFNYLMFDGRRVIEPSRLQELDTTEIGMPYGEGKTRAPVQRFRDGLKYVTAMEDENAAYLLLGIENQSEVSHAMAVKNMVYDALQYAAQVERTASSHREKEKKKPSRERSVKTEKDDTGKKGIRLEAGEYLSGFHKGDRLLPVVTLVILFNPDPWDAPMSIHDMLSIKNPEILAFVPDYRINLIAPAQMEAESMDKFQSGLREVLLYIKYSKDKKKLGELLAKDLRFRELDIKTAIVIDTLTNSKLKFDRKEKKVDMCLAIEEMRRESWKEGEKEGEKRGEIRGEKRGEIRGEIRGEKRGEIRGEKRGEIKGINLINSLNSILIDMNRLDDLKRAVSDPEYQAKLIKELLPDG